MGGDGVVPMVKPTLHTHKAPTHPECGIVSLYSESRFEMSNTRCASAVVVSHNSIDVKY